MTNRIDAPDPVDRTDSTTVWANRAVGVGFVAVIAALVTVAWIASVHNLRVRDGSAEVACAVTSCSPSALALAGWATSMFPVVWCGLYAVCFMRLPVAGRVLGAVLTVLLLLSALFYLPSNRKGVVHTTTEHAEHFMLGMSLGWFALFVDAVLLLAVLMLVNREKRVLRPVWIAVLGAPVAFTALAAAINP